MSSPATTSDTKPALLWFDKIKEEKVEWLWYPYLPLGKLTDLGGDPGAGKSTITLAIAAAVSTGGSLPGQSETRKGRVLLLSAEDGKADTIKPRLVKLGADCAQIAIPPRLFTLSKDGLDRYVQHIHEVRPVVTIIDPLVYFMGADRDLHRANEVRELTAALGEIAEKYGCAILTVRHFTKASQRGAMFRGIGSIDVTAACRSVLVVGDGVLAHAKCNVAPLGPSLKYEMSQAKGLVWTGISPLSADDLNAGPEVKSAMDDAREFLQEFLSKGRMAANDVIAEAERAGVSERTLKRAKNGLARSVLEDGHWWWKLLPPPGVESEPAPPGANAEYADILKRSWDDIPVPKLLRARNAS